MSMVGSQSSERMLQLLSLRSQLIRQTLGSAPSCRSSGDFLC